MELNICADSAGPLAWPQKGVPGERLEAALQALGFERFRVGQREVIEAVMQGFPTVAVMPTGAGKSLCYQLPSLLLPGVTLVVSPLLALMQDQVRRAQARGLTAVSLQASLGREARNTRLREIARRQNKLVFAAPEGLRNPLVLAALREAGVSLLCVDEAHCISAWGHDFRPDYARLGHLRESLQPSAVLAVTATATGRVQRDIAASLGMENARFVVTGFDRPNLALRVENTHGAKDKLAHMERALGEGLRPGGGSGIVYCGTRRSAEEVATLLMARGLPCVAYHAGMTPVAREAAQTAWEQAVVPVICATTAFGMGVDKANVRVVVHHAVPRSPEAYYQEVGRAGRDGEPALGLLLVSGADIRLCLRLLSQACPQEEAVRQAYALAHGCADENGLCAASLEELQERVGRVVGPASRAALVHLMQMGALQLDAVGIWQRGPAPQELEINGAALQARAHAERDRFRQMLAYVQRARCRQAFLVDYFAGGSAPTCGRCDLCTEGKLKPLAEPARVEVLKVLSCVARMMGRFGRARVADVLVATKQKTLERQGLARLSTFGILADRSREEVLALLSALERGGLVCSWGDTYPVLDLTEQGAAVLKSGVVPSLWLPALLEGSPAEPAAAKGLDTHAKGLEGFSQERRAVLRRMHAWRAQTAGAHGVCPRAVMTDRTLKVLAVVRPRTVADLVQIPGVGRGRAERYGASLLAVLGS
jgi:ATP-dependent DNA helicase RecQ